jgi:hypothetical protein
MNKTLEEHCIFLFFGKFLHHWKQKWWKMIKNENEKKNEKTEKKWKKLEENCNFSFFGKLQFSASFFFIFF